MQIHRNLILLPLNIRIKTLKSNTGCFLCPSTAWKQKNVLKYTASVQNYKHKFLSTEKQIQGWLKIMVEIYNVM